MSLVPIPYEANANPLGGSEMLTVFQFSAQDAVAGIFERIAICCNPIVPPNPSLNWVQTEMV